jgi:hypothetical protein
MDFFIQTSNPLIWDQTGTQVERYYEALSKVFEAYTEDAFLIWNDIPVRMTYEHDLYVNLYDMHMLLKSLLELEEGSGRIGWGSDTLNATWNVEWRNNNIKVSSHWNSVAGGYEDLLNSRSNLETSKDLFLREWKMLLRKVIDAIRQSGVIITDKESWNSFCEIESKIETPGHLYVVVNDETSID